jgi:hypothetical protein
MKDNRIQEKQRGHHLPPHATENPVDDTDRNSDKVIKPGQREPEPYAPKKD